MMTLSEASRAVAGNVIGADIRFTSVSTDSRTLESGALFVALRGDRFDGHEYLGAACERGAAAALVERAAVDAGRTAGMPLLAADDTRYALGALAQYWRGRFQIPVIAVVGSNGKTTVKEMLAAILRAHYGERAVLATPGNFNNDIGLPITVLGLRAEHACAVIEIGMNHPDETQYLANITRPTIAVINNAQREHQEFMASVDQVAEEHAAAIRALPDNGIAVLNRDDPYFDYWSGVAGKRSVRDFGIGMLAGLRAAYRLGPTTSDIEFAGGAGRVQVTLQIPGLHNICNALAAAAAALAAGVSTDAVARGLASFRAVKGRTQVKSGRNGVSVIDDTYNANPDSVRAAVDVLAASAAPRVLILGDMGEVGSQGTAFHDELGRYAAERGIDSLLTVGALAHTAAKSFGPGGEHFASVEALIARAQTLTSRKGTMLVKGSRFMRMERVVVHLLAGESEAQCC